MHSRPPVVLGLDVGTSSLKYVAYQIDTSEVRVRATHAYSGHGGRAVHLTDYISAIDEAIVVVSEENEIRAVAFTTQMYSLVTGTGSVVGWDSPWKLAPHLGNEFREVCPASGAQPDPIFPIFKLADIDEQRRRGISLLPYGIKAALIEHYSGRRVVDMSEASATGIYDVRANRWCERYAAWGVPIGDLPMIVRHDERIGVVRKEFGFTDHFAIVPGLGDGVSASVRGAEYATVAANLGTSVAARAIVNFPVTATVPTEVDTDNDQAHWVFRIDEHRAVRGGISRAGFGMLDQFRSAGYAVDAFTKGPEPLFVPWVFGVQWPLWDTRAVPALIGVGPDTSHNAIGSAIRRSVAFGIAWMIESHLPSDGTTPCLVAGGGTGHQLFMDDLAGCVPVPMILPDGADYFAAEGAALSAANAIGNPVELPRPSAKTIQPTGTLTEQFEKWKTVASRPTKAYYL